MTEENRRMKIGFTIDEESLGPFLKEMLSNIQHHCEGAIYNLASYSNNPAHLEKIASKIETLRLQIEDVAHIQKEFELYKQLSQQETQQEKQSDEKSILVSEESTG